MSPYVKGTMLHNKQSIQQHLYKKIETNLTGGFLMEKCPNIIQYTQFYNGNQNFSAGIQFSADWLKLEIV